MIMQACAMFVNIYHLPGAFWIQRITYRVEVMSTSDLASLPSRAWSCSTLQQGVAKCAEMAGVTLNPHDMADAMKARIYHVIGGSV